MKESVSPISVLDVDASRCQVPPYHVYKRHAVKMESEQVQVALRVRDLVPRERLEGFFSCIHVSQSAAVVGGERSFAFDYAFGPDSTQANVYDSSVKPLIESALSGVNVTVLAYGQTGSGKTHTMGTDGLLGKSPDEYGVVPRIACDVFQACKEMVGVSIVVSALEIYGEELRDLINDDRKTKLQIREDRGGQISVVGLQEVTVSSTEELLEVLGSGLLRRATGSTNMNAASSRSHALCTITLQTPAPPSTAGSPCKYPCMSQPAATVYSKIQLVDLAGSERLSQTLSKTTKETCQINRGLHALSNVIMALSAPNTSGAPPPHVPYRDSRLTRVLQDSLGGSARTLMIACVSAADESVQESLSTLQYATRARRIQNRITATAPLEPPTDDSIVNLQWTLLRKYLSCVGLMPIPEVLMQDVHGKGDEDTRVALLQAANKLFPASTARPPPRARSDAGLQQASTAHLTGCSSPGALPPSQALVPQSLNGGRSHALSEPGCSPLSTTTSEAHPISASACTPPPQPNATAVGVCSVETASQTVPAETHDATTNATEPQRSTPLRPAIVHPDSDLQNSVGPQSHDIAKKYLSHSQDGWREPSGSFWPPPARPTSLDHAAELEECPSETDLSLPSPNITEVCGWSDRASRSDPFGASYISSTDYTSARDIAGHHARLLAEHEGAALAAADTQQKLLETIRELEAAVVFQEGALQDARDVEMRACRERDHARRACAQLQHQIDSQHQELENLHKGMRELEATLGRSEADKAAARALYEERVHAANARKKELERQLRSQAAAASEGAAAAPKIRELGQHLDKLQASKAAAVRELRACQTEHKQREAKMQAQLVALQRRLRGSERRAAMLQQDKSRTATALQRKHQQLQDSKQALQSLQASLEASEKRAASTSAHSTPADKATRRQRSQDGGCGSVKSAASDATENTLAQKTAWWDEQISLLAQRLSAGKRAEQLQHRLTDVAQQVAVTEQSASPENITALEDLRLQQHVLKSSLAVGRERAASSSLIQRNLQHAAATLSPPALRKVLLHLVSSTLSAYAAACTSRAEAHHLQSSLDRTSKLNELLTVQVASSNGSSALFSAAGALQMQVHAAHVAPALMGSPRQPPHAPAGQSPHRARAMQDLSASYCSPSAMGCAVNSAGKQAVCGASVNQPDALSASDLVLNSAHASPMSLSTNPPVSPVGRRFEQQVQLKDAPQMPKSMHSSSSSTGLGGPQSLAASQAPGPGLDDISGCSNRTKLQTSGHQSAMIGARHEHLPESPAQNDADPNEAVDPADHAAQSDASKLSESIVLPSAAPQHGVRPTTPVAGLRTHGMHATGLQSHAITHSASFRSTDFAHGAGLYSTTDSHGNDISAMHGAAGSGHRERPSPASTSKQSRPRSATPKRVSFADEHDCEPSNPEPAARSLFAACQPAGGVLLNEGSSARSVASMDPNVQVSKGGATCTGSRVLLERSGSDDLAQNRLESPRASYRSAAAAGVGVGVGRCGHRNSNASSMAGSLSSFKVRDNPVAAESEGMIDSRYQPLAFPAGAGPPGDSKWMPEQRVHSQADLTTPVKQFGTSSLAATGVKEPQSSRSQREFGNAGNSRMQESPVGVGAPQAKRVASPRPARTPPAKVQAYRKKLEELQAKSCDARR